MDRNESQATQESDAARAQLRDRIREVCDFLRGRPIDQSLQSALNSGFPSSGDWYRDVNNLIVEGVNDGWACQHEAGGIRYGRIFKPESELSDFSLDLVWMADVVGPRHRHPNGEIDLIFPMSEGAAFDGVTDGWKVYEPQSVHNPTVTNGEAYVMYLLPGGAIDFKEV